ncbi:MAG TPA: phosphoadenylyl-sulfate reductase [Thermohalobaculum sp.]|nr:phosphoadenylyl-sulfate reductase [Thermohalobaculum sp.]
MTRLRPYPAPRPAPAFGVAPRAPFRRLSPHGNALVLNRVHAQSSAEVLLEDVIRQQYPGSVALVSSFGAESAVLLDMVARIEPATPVLFLETGMLFPETLAYQRELAARLSLADVRLIRPDPADLAADDPDGTLHRDNADGCCFIRKTLPLRRALAPFGAWIAGQKRVQAATRAGIELVEEDRENGLLKVNPLAHWDGATIRAYMERHNLPRHPLVTRGYLSIGCAPCTTPVRPGEDPRAGRWRDSAKVECGIHFDGEKWVRTGPAPGG